MTDAELISTVRSLRKQVVLLDALGYPTRQLATEPDMTKLVPKGLTGDITEVASKIHSMIQNIEHSKRYKEAVKQLCGIKERD